MQCDTSQRGRQLDARHTTMNSSHFTNHFNMINLSFLDWGFLHYWLYVENSIPSPAINIKQPTYYTCKHVFHFYLA